VKQEYKTECCQSEIIANLCWSCGRDFPDEVNHFAFTKEQANDILEKILQIEYEENAECYDADSAPEDHWHWSGDILVLLHGNDYQEIYNQEDIYWMSNTILWNYIGIHSVSEDKLHN
jgi:hypothetical protein